MKITEFHELNIKMTKSFFTKDGMVPGSMLALIPEGKLVLCQRSFENNKEKQLTFNHYAVILAVKNATMYSFISEMWFAKEEKGPFRLPSQRSDRKEGIFIASRDNNGNSEIKMLEILRNASGTQLIDAEFDGGVYEDKVNLFARVDPNKLSPEALRAIGKEFNEITKPDWYSEIDLRDVV